MLNVQPYVEIIANDRKLVHFISKSINEVSRVTWSPVMGYHYKMYVCLDSKLLGLYHTLSENPLMGMIEPFYMVCMDDIFKIVCKCGVSS